MFLARFDELASSHATLHQLPVVLLTHRRIHKDAVRGENLRDQAPAISANSSADGANASRDGVDHFAFGRRALWLLRQASVTSTGQLPVGQALAPANVDLLAEEIALLVSHGSR